MTTKCTTEQLAFQGLGRREVVGRFDVRNPADREHSFWLNVNTDSGSS